MGKKKTGVRLGRRWEGEALSSFKIGVYRRDFPIFFSVSIGYGLAAMVSVLRFSFSYLCICGVSRLALLFLTLDIPLFGVLISRLFEQMGSEALFLLDIWCSKGLKES